MQTMHDMDEHNRTERPLMRIITLGEFALERLVPTPSRAQDEPPLYARGTKRVEQPWTGDGPAEGAAVPGEPSGIQG